MLVCLRSDVFLLLLEFVDHNTTTISRQFLGPLGNCVCCIYTIYHMYVCNFVISYLAVDIRLFVAHQRILSFRVHRVRRCVLSPISIHLFVPPLQIERLCDGDNVPRRVHCYGRVRGKHAFKINKSVTVQSFSSLVFFCPSSPYWLPCSCARSPHNMDF